MPEHEPGEDREPLGGAFGIDEAAEQRCPVLRPVPVLDDDPDDARHDGDQHAGSVQPGVALRSEFWRRHATAGYDARVPGSRFASLFIAAALAASATGCAVLDAVGNDAIDAGSVLHGLQSGVERPIGDAIVEPSDLAFDPETGTLWTVSDADGTLHRIAPDGAVAGSAIPLGGKDLEGVALDPKSGHLFVADEATAEIIEVKRTGEIVRRFKVDVRTGNSGVEGIAYDAAKDGFVLAIEKPAELVFVDRSGKITSRARIETQSIGAVAAVPSGSTFLVAARFEEAILEVDRAGTLLNRFSVNYPGIEGIALDDRNRLYAVADLGSNARGMLYLFVRGGSS